MGNDGLLYVLGRVQWQYFVTLTFLRAGHTRTERLRMILAWLRWTAKLSRTRFEGLKWCIRWERGELFQRMHCHALIAGVPFAYVNTTSLVRQGWAWGKVGGGLPDVRLYNPTLRESAGLEYVLSGLSGADVYETSKFGASTSELTVSESIIRLIAASRGRAARTSQEHSPADNGVKPTENSQRRL